MTLLGDHQLRVHGIRSTRGLTHQFLGQILPLDQIFSCSLTQRRTWDGVPWRTSWEGARRRTSKAGIKSTGSQIDDGRETAGGKKTEWKDQVAAEGTSGVDLEATREARLCYVLTHILRCVQILYMEMVRCASWSLYVRLCIASIYVYVYCTNCNTPIIYMW
jgi:hypothetical protein